MPLLRPRFVKALEICVWRRNSISEKIWLILHNHGQISVKSFKENRLRTCSRVGITVDSAPMFLFRIKYILMLAHNENCVADYVEYKYKIWHRVANMDHLELIDCRLNIFRTYIVWTYYHYHRLCHLYHHHHYLHYHLLSIDVLVPRKQHNILDK